MEISTSQDYAALLNILCPYESMVLPWIKPEGRRLISCLVSVYEIDF